MHPYTTQTGKSATNYVSLQNCHCPERLSANLTL
ncbi:unnamed protein product [Callosobruchus maculatus]|uniref:Uncharacterized protein n=1 Tax=Callosobruchus maculatus TaxID=64391 RepID=A0A653DIZ4_CALMS|nr:unnamed protein product [Callosobruchus maculatus]